MFYTPSSFSPTMSRVVEKQMRNWEIARQQQDGGSAPRAGSVMDFIAISRSVGLPGEEIAAQLHAKLGWPVFDREILQAMAGDDECRRQLYDAMDERDLGWMEEFLQSVTFGAAGKDDYFHRLRETVLSLARKGHSIFLGRATDMILPREMGLRVRFTASRDYCVKQFAKTKNIAEDQARREVEDIEHERARFIRHHFRVEAGEPSRHDLTINLEFMPVLQAVDLVHSALRIKGIIR
ncbi:MAG TPA: cytidylate kinase-like family protein [Phycisphaerae bacterium]|nr:cytidylate kinase-like family protein [Phycisphaerae bacterium]